jgi:hypothetical protein
MVEAMVLRRFGKVWASVRRCRHVFFFVTRGADSHTLATHSAIRQTRRPVARGKASPARLALAGRCGDVWACVAGVVWAPG